LDQEVYLKQKLKEFEEYIGQEPTPLPIDYQKLLEDAKKERVSVGQGQR